MGVPAGDSRTHHKMVEAETSLGWFREPGHICYQNETTKFCGVEEDCYIGMALPFINESTWDWRVRAVLYLVGLLYSFLGISIISDIFMCAIEKITSKTTEIQIAGDADSPSDVIEVPVWNNTVANLTLMALGSSAPEILLAVIGIIGNNFESEKLGPSTIVGSASFHLLAISAVCIAGVPTNEIRRIKAFPVFIITSFFSIFAYLWIVIVLVVSSPDKVDLWEAIVTFLLFPFLVVIAFFADKGHFNKIFCQGEERPSEKGEKQLELGPMAGESQGMLPSEESFFKNGRVNKEALVDFIKTIKKNTNLSDEDAAIMAASKVVDSRPKSKMWYRINATRNMTGGRKIQPTFKMNDKLKEVYDAINDDVELPNIDYPDSDASKAIIEFHASSAAVLESIGTFKVLISRHGNMRDTVQVKVETIDGSANEGEDYIAINETLTFEPFQKEKEVSVTIVDDNQWEPDEEFFLKLALVKKDPTLHAGDCDHSGGVKLGRTSIMEIKILNDDEPGTFQFERRGHLVKESCGEALLSVLRENGADGDLKVKWKTIDKTAVSGKDFTGGEGELEFKHGETQRTINIPIIDDMDVEKDENFEVELYEVDNGGKLGKITKTAVTITNDDEFNTIMNKMMMMTNANVDELRVQNETWAQQMKDAMVVNGGDIDGASTADYIMHFLTFPFKVIFALIPPAGLLGGFPCFFISLLFIGIIVIIVGDLAGIFGCLIGLKDEVTAITFVALGTSLPDTFASKAAAVNEKHADNAIGNVTGSNSVNVFLGLGLPWVIAACYHFSSADGFEVKAGALTFSVTIYIICAVIAISLIMARRFLPVFGQDGQGAELGGNTVLKYISASVLLFLWFLYVILSSLQTYGYIGDPFAKSA